MILMILQTYEDALDINPTTLAGYGALVFGMALAVWTLWKDNKELRIQNASQVDKMLSINAESIPILTNVISTLQNHEGINKAVVDHLDQLKRDHKSMIELLESLNKAKNGSKEA